METKHAVLFFVVLVTSLLICATAGEKRQSEVFRPAFSAGLTQMLNVSDHVNVTYDRVFLNLGNIYDPSTGYFTAPYDGTYLFTFHGLAENTGQLWLDLYVNDKYISSAYAHITAQYAAASNAVVIYMDRGDFAYIMGRGSSTLYGDPHEVYSTFSGYLLYYSSA